MTKLGQAPARDETDVLAKGPKTDATNIPASCQKIDLTGKVYTRREFGSEFLT